MNTSIAPYLNSRVIIMDSETPCQFVAQTMRDRNIGSVVLSDKYNQIAGIVTDRDLTCNLLADRLSADIPVKAVMTEDVQVVNEDADLEEVIHIMEYQGIRRVPVVSASKKRTHKCIGIITLDDLLLAGAIPPGQRLTDLLAQQVAYPIANNAAEERSTARKTQKYNQFRKRIASRINLEVQLTEIIFKEVFGEVVQRLPLDGAVKFVAQLPCILKEELLSLPAGPNRGITATVLLKNLMSKTALHEDEIRKVIPDIWIALGDLTSRAEIEGTLAQLPRDVVELLTMSTVRNKS